ncbi:MAG: acyl-CoA thioesterase [Lentisphaeraceae bacterium]|nr:acyl-CoA thioesterase [Lentisphaeraceae bacterium]
MSLTAEVIIDIPFHDVDAMEVVWHGHYIKYFEAARNELLRKIDYDYSDMEASGYLWPVIESKCRHISPAKYTMKIRVEAEIAEWENRLFIKYLITDSANAKKVCKGHTIQVAVKKENGEMLLASPQVLLDKIKAVES